ncbi:Helicase conserved C-terminal domain-containing protein [Malonomonas rubra DSM 5091]|uniref:Helicase conserved C-terminal domain-containing protein n=2 Tax=Malonomonas rubra TaxID=57040 RepID=A0A1M6N7X0_MALRU|nr:Helicase conserved C-terminal domain-containing protein [Malonomonas rubra DSM 5091]
MPEDLALLHDALGPELQNCFVLHGRLSKKQRASVLSELESLDADAPRILLATGRLIGEGFDHPPLDTLFLALPISWKGTLQQYAGRLHREHSHKSDVHIYDYHEHDHTQLTRMWNKRLRGYKAMGYAVSN